MSLRVFGYDVTPFSWAPKKMERQGDYWMLQKLLGDSKESILAKWTDRVFRSYQPEMTRFLEREKNRFANPVRHTLEQGLRQICEAFVDEKPIDACSPGLKEIIKLRAVQSFSPSQALDFIFGLKKILHEELRDRNDNGISEQAWTEIDNKLDALLGLSFDMYSDCREKIYEIRLSEIKARTDKAFKILERTNMLENDEVDK